MAYPTPTRVGAAVLASQSVSLLGFRYAAVRFTQSVPSGLAASNIAPEQDVLSPSPPPPQETAVVSSSHSHSTTPKQQGRDPAIVRQQRLDRRRQQTTYQIAAIAASSFIVATAILATWYRIMLHLDNGEAFPYIDLALTLLLAAGGMVGMEMYARFAHKILWHDNKLGYAIHKSHHVPRVGAFEANDIYAVMNAVPAVLLCGYGFLRPDMIGGMCFGAGLGISLFGMSYLFIHDGLVHKRFPVGPLADVPELRRIAIAHQIHHTDKFGGVPYGMFLGPQEIEAVGGKEDLDRLVAARANVKTDSAR
ncbi:putative Beta-carotene 3-hydroxylase, chloroplastic [Nannochloris sp. 'desiccata']|nr:hypothetical protein KSW81_003731 [Chlorella desiccata (nom. nud.)]KAH7615919.1 putative Beta-carotene 3-hydroxylase, chloroplastic [Chlorella desiccata (nom. nud.)]